MLGCVAPSSCVSRVTVVSVLWLLPTLIQSCRRKPPSALIRYDHYTMNVHTAMAPLSLTLGVHMNIRLNYSNAHRHVSAFACMWAIQKQLHCSRHRCPQRNGVIHPHTDVHKVIETNLKCDFCTNDCLWHYIPFIFWQDEFQLFCHHNNKMPFLLDSQRDILF